MYNFGGIMERTAEDIFDPTRDDLVYWESIAKPIGYIVVGWRYRQTAELRGPSGDYISVDRKILELITACRAAAK